MDYKAGHGGISLLSFADFITERKQYVLRTHQETMTGIRQFIRGEIGAVSRGY